MSACVFVQKTVDGDADWTETGWLASSIPHCRIEYFSFLVGGPQCVMWSIIVELFLCTFILHFLIAQHSTAHTHIRIFACYPYLQKRITVCACEAPLYIFSFISGMLFAIFDIRVSVRCTMYVYNVYCIPIIEYKMKMKTENGMNSVFPSI